MSRRVDRTDKRYTTDQVEEWFRENAESTTTNGEEKLTPDEIALRDKTGYYEAAIGRATGNQQNEEEGAEEERKQEATKQLIDALDGDDDAIELGIDLKRDLADIHSTKLLHRSREEAISARAHANELHAGVEDRRIAGPNGTTIRLDERGRYRDESNNRISPERVAQLNAGNPDFADMEEARQGIFQARRAEFIQRRRERGVNGQEPGQERSARWSANEGIQISPALAKLGDAFGDAATHIGKPTPPTTPAFTPDLQQQAKQQAALALSPSGG